jgi:hypothetical protein
MALDYYSRRPLFSKVLAIPFTLTKITINRMSGTRYPTAHATMPSPDIAIVLPPQQIIFGVFSRAIP